METKSVKELLVTAATELDKSGLNKEGAVFKVLNEETRFRQDCRKKALEIANNEYMAIINQGKGELINVVDLAEKYYQWLTNQD